jgi:hypothetical protein
MAAGAAAGPAALAGIGTNSEVEFATAQYGSQSVAIAHSFGLCCLFGVTDGKASWPPFPPDSNARPGENAEAGITPPLSGLVLRDIYMYPSVVLGLTPQSTPIGRLSERRSK